MLRNSLTDMAARSMHQAVRMKLGKLGKINDNPMMQELDFSGMFADARKFVERVQSFGFSSVPLPMKGGQGGQQGGQGGSRSISTFADGGDGGGVGDSANPGQEEAAEGIAIFLNGQRNHPVVIGVDDRRHRPMGLKPGENAQYDDIQQMTLMRRDGLYLLSNDNEDADGQKKERMASLRHVEKKKQERKAQVKQKTSYQLAAMTARQRMDYVNALAQQAKDDEQKQNFKHEGDTVNTEVRVTKKKIEFREGNNVKGSYDKQSDKWTHTSQTHDINASNQVNIGNQRVNITGSQGINVTGPTSINGSAAATQMHLTALEKKLLERIATLEARVAELSRRP